MDIFAKWNGAKVKTGIKRRPDIQILIFIIKNYDG